MTKIPQSSNLADLATTIWNAGVQSVLGDASVERHVHVDDDAIHFGTMNLSLSSFRQLIVIGAGKAAGAMARGLEEALGDDVLTAKDAHGWLNVPDGTNTQSRYFHLHPARPMGVNEPTDLACSGTQAILELVRNASPDDLCVCLLSGGASALLVAPSEGISLAEKQAVVRALSAAGADIRDLNIVRRNLSTVKGGGLAHACRAGQLITLVLSDVLGDPLDVIGSAPTFPVPSVPAEALEILERYRVTSELPTIVSWLRRRAIEDQSAIATSPSASLHHLIVGNLSCAIQAAAKTAEQLGFTTTVLPIHVDNPTVESEVRSLTQSAIPILADSNSVCIISGGEPVVQLAKPSVRGRGGRNQQFALAAGYALANALDTKTQWVILSAGTDGEDGPTDAAGAIWDEHALSRAVAAGLDPIDHLDRNDAYSFFQGIHGLFQTGATGTNVCDLRVLLFQRPTTTPSPRIAPRS